MLWFSYYNKHMWISRIIQTEIKSNMCSWVASTAALSEILLSSQGQHNKYITLVISVYQTSFDKSKPLTFLNPHNCSQNMLWDFEKQSTFLYICCCLTFFWTIIKSLSQPYLSLKGEQPKYILLPYDDIPQSAEQAGGEAKMFIIGELKPQHRQ